MRVEQLRISPRSERKRGQPWARCRYKALRALGYPFAIQSLCYSRRGACARERAHADQPSHLWEKEAPESLIPSPFSQTEPRAPSLSDGRTGQCSSVVRGRRVGVPRVVYGKHTRVVYRGATYPGGIYLPICLPRT